MKKKILLITCCQILLHVPLFATPPQKPELPQTEREKLKLDDEVLKNLETFSSVLQILENYYVEPEKVKNKKLVNRAIQGMVKSLDPHTTYLPPQQLKDFASDTSGKFGGIGVLIHRKKGKLIIQEVLDDSPAQESGVQDKDIIVSVGSIKVTKNNHSHVLGLMRGIPGTKLKMEVQAQTEKAPVRKVTITRRIIKTKSVKVHKLEKGIPHVRIQVFQKTTGEEVERALRQFEAPNGGKLDGLILDLRGNRGGLFDQAVRIADLFINNGIIVSTVGRNRKKEDIEVATKRATHPHMPLVVLVDSGSASASEILAGAIQDHKRGLILGETTFGKGSVQQIIDLPNGAGLKITTARYFTPSGRSIQAKGITPDIEFPDSGVAAKSSEKKKNKKVTREKDLKNHIEAKDLEPDAQSATFQKSIQSWPEKLKKDKQLVAAYTYLKGWSRFSSFNKKSSKKN